MSKIDELKYELSLYSGWTKEEETLDIEIEEKNSETQKSGLKTEAWVEACIKKVFGDDVFVFKMSSQEYPDFFIFNKSIYDLILEYNKYKRNEIGEIEYYKRTKLKGNPKIEKKNPSKQKILLTFDILKSIPPAVWISVKHVGGTNYYRTNKNPPELGSNVIYINFCGKDKTVWVTTAHDIAVRAGITKDDSIKLKTMMKRHNEELRNLISVDVFVMLQYLLGSGVAQKHMNVNSSVEDIEKIFRDSKIKIDDEVPIIDKTSIIQPKSIKNLQTLGFFE